MVIRSASSLIRLSLILLIGMAPAVQVFADAGDAFEFFQEEAKVVTASRRPQPIDESPVAVEVVTREEIEASGVSNLWDLLRFRPGMDVLDGHTPIGNRAIVSVRGFDEGFARNVLVLLDGRNVYASDSAGVYWDQLPISLQDIERIEIIRGPNAALYGSGAGLGVINIISKKPSGMPGVTVQTFGGNRSTVQTSEALESSRHSLDFRLSHTWREQEGFDSLSGGVGNDYSRSHKANFRSTWSPAQGSDLELFAGGSWSTYGIPNVDTSRDQLSQHFEMLKFHMETSEHSHLDLSSSRNDYQYTIDPTAAGDIDHLRNYAYDEEILHRVDWADGRLNSTYGLNYQNTAAYSAHTFADNPEVSNEIWRGFFNQTVHVGPQLTLVGATAWETTDQGKPHKNYQMASLWKPIEDQSFRAAYSVAHTIPNLRMLYTTAQFNDAVARKGNPDLQPETLTSYELGYRGSWLGRHLEAESNLFYTRIDGIDIDTDLGTLPNAPSVNVLGFINGNQAIARGAEAQFKYRFSPKRLLYANYTFEHITDRTGNAGEITQNTPAHKLNFGGMADLGHGISGSVNVGYKDNYFITNLAESAAVPAYWRLDARLAYTINSKVELFMAGQNLAANTHVEFADGLAISRTYQGGVSLKFGGKE